MRRTTVASRVRRSLLLVTFIVAAAIGASIPAADSEATRDGALHALVNSFCDAWNRHDGHALAAIMAEDVDFVNVGARWFHGRRDFETYHTRLLSGRFAQSQTGALDIKSRLIRKDLAAIHWSWWIAGDKNADGTARPKRFGLMTLIAERRGGQWQVVVAQNTNLIFGAAPEEEGLASPIQMPESPES